MVVRAPCAEDELSMMDRLDRVIPKLREVVAAANGWEEEQQVTTDHRPSFESSLWIALRKPLATWKS